MMLKQKNKNREEHVVGLNTEHADLLNFKTGFKPFAERRDREEKKEKV